MPDDIAERRRIFRTLVPYFGTVQPASFFRDTSAVVKGVKRIHPLIEGIYKPAGSFYPLSIASMLKSRYGDQLFHNPDRTWWMRVQPESRWNGSRSQCWTCALHDGSTAGTRVAAGV